MRWTYEVGPQWTDPKGLGELLRATGKLLRWDREVRLQKYIEASLIEGHTGATIRVEDD